MGKRFYIVDVFAESVYQGNQLAVVRDASGLSRAEMQRIAREFNFSETAFILSESETEGAWPVRIFTPQDEVPFAGHPTLGTAYVIKLFILTGRDYKTSGTPERPLLIDLPAGKIPVTFASENGEDVPVVWMEQNPPKFGPAYTPAEIAPILRIRKEDIAEILPLQEVSTGLPFLIVPLKTLKAVKDCSPDRAKLLDFGLDKTAKDILVFSKEAELSENNLHVRVFVEYHGVPEDPATGSGNGCLAAYCARYGLFGREPFSIRAEQGFEIGRPSLLYLRGESDSDKIRVRVGGKVFPVASGELF